VDAFLVAAAAEVAFFLLVLAADSTQRRRQRRLAGAETLEFGLAESSKRLGLGLKRYRGGKRLRLSGRIAGSRVAIEFLWRDEGAWATTVTLVPHPPLAHDIWFQSRWTASDLDEPSVAHSDLDTGDTVFDKLIEVGGRALTLRALLNGGACSSIVRAAAPCVYGRAPWSRRSPR
jgi:hypothetical protein